MSNPTASGRLASAVTFSRRAWTLELGDLFRRHRLGSLLTRLLPHNSMHCTRTRVLRLFGWRLGHGATLAATPQLLGSGALHRRLTIGSRTYVNVGAIWDVGAGIHIGENVHIGPNVSLLTTSHRVGGAVCRAGALTRSPINIGRGSWIAAGATVHAGVSVGEDAIVASGCVVLDDVPANCVFGGVPGRVIRLLD